MYAVLWVADRFVGWETPKNNVFDLIGENFENLNSISNIFQKTHDFLVFTNSVINFTYYKRASVNLFEKSTDRHFRDQGNIRHTTPTVIKMRFGPNIE